MCVVRRWGFMKKLLLSVSLCAAVFACKKKDDAAADKPAAADKAPAADDKAAKPDDKAAPAGDLATIDCDAMTKHTEEMAIKAAKDKSEADGKTMEDNMKAGHDQMVQACKDDKTQKLTKKQYDCYMGAGDMMAAAVCLQ